MGLNILAGQESRVLQLLTPDPRTLPGGKYLMVGKFVEETPVAQLTTGLF
jgi:hypothetical protein